MPVWAVLPAKGFLWGLYDRRTNPAHQIAAFETMATEIGLREPIYTDINDVAVMGLLHRPRWRARARGTPVCRLGPRA